MSDNTMRDIAVSSKLDANMAMINTLTEEAKILGTAPVIQANDGLQHLSNVMSEVEGAQLVNMDESLPAMSATSDFETTDLSILGGSIEVGEQKAKKYKGGKEKYFADQFPTIFKKTGEDTNKALIYGANGLRAYANANGKLVDIGGTSAGKQYTILAVTWTDNEMCLMGDSSFFGGTVNGSELMMDIDDIGNGGTYHDANGVLVYGKRIIGNIGLLMKNARYISGMSNIDLTPAVTDSGFTKFPTIIQMEEMLDECRANERTIMYASPKLVTALSVFKDATLRTTTQENGLSYRVLEWDGVPIIADYTFTKGENQVVI